MGKEISSVIIEGIQGVGGINVADDSFLKRSVRFVMNMALFILPIVFNVVMAEAENFSVMILPV